MHTKQILITFYNITISLRNLAVSHLQKCSKMDGKIQLCMKPTFLEITEQEKRKYANLCTFKRTFVIKISLHLNSLKGFLFVLFFLILPSKQSETISVFLISTRWKITVLISGACKDVYWKYKSVLNVRKELLPRKNYNLRYKQYGCGYIFGALRGTDIARGRRVSGV